MTESNSIDISKKLSEELETKIQNVNQKYAKAKNEIKAEILDIYNSAMIEGFTPMQARRLCEQRIEIFSDRTIRRWLPGEATRSYSSRQIGHLSNIEKVKQIALSKPSDPNQVRLVVPEEPKIPPPPQVIQEVESEPEPPKPINQPISIPQKIVKIVFDPAPIDRDRTQVFIIHYDLSTNTIKKYETVGRRSIK